MSDHDPEMTRVVAIGGGAGMKALLGGLKSRSVDLCAVITVADDGGSSGRLRKDFNIPPPGAIRDCLVAMSEGDPILARLFEYRFDDSYLKDHNFGNLFIAALTRVSGDFRGALEQARRLLEVRGRVIPATDRKVTLVAEHPDGSKSTGQVVIAESKKPISAVRLAPLPGPIGEDIAREIARADLVCVGPGKFYTEVLPNLLVPGMVAALNAGRAPILYVSNLMTEPGQTGGFTPSDQHRILRELSCGLEVDMILAPSDTIDEEQRRRYAESGSVPVVVLDEDIDGVPLHRANLVEAGPKVRHSPERLANSVLDCLAILKQGREGRS